MKIILFGLLSFLTLTQFIFAERVEVTSTSMEAEQIKKEIHFIGNAKITKGRDWLHANRVIIYFNDNNDTSMYEARGNVRFEFKKNRSHYRGKANNVKYYPLKSLYLLSGRAVIDDIANKRHLKGNRIELNMKTGDAKIKGTRRKPVKFIFNMKDK